MEKGKIKFATKANVKLKNINPNGEDVVAKNLNHVKFIFLKNIGINSHNIMDTLLYSSYTFHSK
jgi:hypothetical protein